MGVRRVQEAADLHGSCIVDGGRKSGGPGIRDEQAPDDDLVQADSPLGREGRVIVVEQPIRPINRRPRCGRVRLRRQIGDPSQIRPMFEHACEAISRQLSVFKHVAHSDMLTSQAFAGSSYQYVCQS
jgi:hypothetical protein